MKGTMAMMNTFDSVARLTGTWLNNSTNGTLDSATYGYNTGNQRTTFTNAAGTYLGYTYDPIGQLKIADSSVNTEDRGYTYDASWNLNYRTNNGVLSTFSVDNKNQLTNTTSVGTQTYDANGNLTYSDGPSNGYGYDDENRLANWYYYDGGHNGNGNPTSGGDYRAEFVYDGKGRLRKRVEYQADGGGTTWLILSGTRYIYDGMRVIQERNSANTPLVSYTRGTDLSGSLEGAGGIGGLLGRSHGYASTNGNWYTHNFYHADGNGNVTYLVNSSQTLAASYRYDPFGNTTASSGSLASANVYRFSSKETHVNSGLYYYGYRWYAPSLQRWLNRDPRLDAGHKLVRQACTACDASVQFDGNAFRFCDNKPVTGYDAFGLLTQEQCEARFDKAKKAADREAAKCAASALKWGLVLEIVLGGGGAAGGAALGGPPGAGVGAFCGTGVAAIIDLMHYSHCMEKYNKIIKDAKDALKECEGRVNE